MLPKLDGLTVIQRLREQKIRTPVIILSARHTVDDRVKGLETGGDDYLTKPFAFSELLARVQALMRRATSASEATRLVVGDLVMDLTSRRVTREGREIPLRPREFALLEYLMRNAGRVVSKTMILAHVWDYNFDPRTNVVDVLVFRLRDRIDKGFDRKMLQTVRGMGRTITVRGQSKGRLIARELVWVHETAHVKGDVAAPKIILEDGAVFNGSVEPGRTDAALIVAAYRGKTESPVAP